MSSDGPPGISAWLGALALAWTVGFVGTLVWLIMYTIAQRGIIP